MTEIHQPTPPHLGPTPVTTLRRGSFWVEGTTVKTEDGQHLLQGQMYVEWLAPERVTRAWPLVLVHGGGGQGTDWLTTPDGRPGWAYRFAAEGYAVYVVDRPGHGRSPYHPDVLGAPGPQSTMEAAAGLFAVPDAQEQTQWPWGRQAGSPELEQLTAGMSFLLADAEFSQRLDGEALTRLLRQIGRSVLVTHSAGAPAGWLALNQVPNLVAGVVAVEPMAPPFMDIPGFGSLPWGLTATPVVCDPPIENPESLQDDATQVQILGFERASILVVAGDQSGFGQATGPAVVEYLRSHDADPCFLDLGQNDIRGNGHGLIFEVNSEQTITPVLEWIEELASDAPSGS